MTSTPARRALRFWLIAATLALPLAASLAQLAYAEGRGHDRGHGEYRDQGRGHDQRGRGYRQDRDSRGHNEGYFHRPDLYYSAPPVVVQHPAYSLPAPRVELRLPYFYR
jgi:hypothetical protein